MSKKIMMLALAVACAAVFALPATASALVPLHLSATPAANSVIDDIGADPTLSTSGGTTVTCDSFTGTATFAAGGTTGTMSLTFGPNCRGPLGVSCTSSGESSGNIATTVLPFDLVTLAGNAPGVLVTPNNGHFATFSCFGVQTVVTGNGVIGKITSPGCNGSSKEPTIDFNATAHGTQEVTKVAGTETVYTLKKGAENAAQDATGKLTLSNTPTLTCT